MCDYFSKCCVYCDVYFSSTHCLRVIKQREKDMHCLGLMKQGKKNDQWDGVDETFYLHSFSFHVRRGITEEIDGYYPKDSQYALSWPGLLHA